MNGRNADPVPKGIELMTFECSLCEQRYYSSAHVFYIHTARMKTYESYVSNNNRELRNSPKLFFGCNLHFVKFVSNLRSRNRKNLVLNKATVLLI
jgi:hypothetical protein